MKVPPLLSAMKRVIRRIQVDYQSTRGMIPTLDEGLDKEPIHCLGVDCDLPIPIVCRQTRSPPLKPPQSAAACQRLASISRRTPILATGILLPDHRCQQLVPTQLVMVIQVLISQGQSKYPLSHQVVNAVLGELRPAVVIEALGEPTQNPPPTLHLPQQQCTTI
jgi:hypothetical protein